MKNSLKLLGVEASSLDELKFRKSDAEIVSEALDIEDINEKINFLKEHCGQKVAGNPESKRYLISLIKKDEVELACDLMFSVCTYSPADPRNFLLFAEIAMEHKAWYVAKTALEVVIWLTNEKQLDLKDKAKDYLLNVQEKINSNVEDKTQIGFWRNKPVDKYWILERLYYQGKKEKLIKLGLKLLDMYSNDLSNYDVVHKAFTLTEDKNVLEMLCTYLISSCVLDNENKNLYLGMTYYSMDNFDEALEYIVRAVEINPKNLKAKYYLALILVMLNKLKDFVLLFNKMVPTSEASFIALYFIFCAVSNFKLDEIEFPDQKNISSEVAKIIKKLLNVRNYDLAFYLIGQFKKLNYHVILPFLNLYLADLLIRENMIKEAKELLVNCKDEEVHRLWAWIYRIEGKNDLAEGEMVEFRKRWKPEKDKGITCKPVSLHAPEIVPEGMDEIFKSIKGLFDETKSLTRNIELEYGLNEMTCIETGCQDCCKKTFPYVSYVEYLYLKDYIDKQPENFQKLIYEKSKSIVNKYKELYKKDPPLVLGGREEAEREYPTGFRFDCPCLGDNKCNVYENRPFTCRAYGYGTSDGSRYKGCSYFFEQFKGASKLSAIRRVVDMNSFINYAEKVDIHLIGKHVIAPIPVWFSSTYEENLEKIKSMGQ